MIQFLNPVFLWGLLGVSIPIGIHLLSRKEGKVIRMGSLRHLQETSTQKFKGIRLNEILLLILRCLLISLLILLLSDVRYTGSTEAEKKWLLIEPGLENDKRLTKLQDSLVSEGFEVRFFAKHFPLLDVPPEDSTTNYRILVDKLRSKNLKEICILATSTPSRFAGLQTALPENIHWISLSRDPVQFHLRAWKHGNDSIAVRTGYSDEEHMRFETSLTASRTQDDVALLNDTLHVFIHADAQFHYDKTLIEAALQAIAREFSVNLLIADYSKNEFNTSTKNCFLLWLSEAPTPEAGTATLISFKPSSGQILQHLKPKHWILTKHLHEELVVQQHFTLMLASILLNRENELKKLALYDRQMINDSLIWADQPTTVTSKQAMILHNIDSWLISLFILLLISERIVAYKRKQ